MPRVAIQIDYTDFPSGHLDWLEGSLSPRLEPLGLDATVHVAPNRISNPIDNFSNSSLYHFTNNIIENSAIKRSADMANDWYVHVLITTKHISGHLGLMYDVGFDLNSRQGCAVFTSEIESITHSNAEFSKVLTRVIMHELGHCFNLIHTNDLSLMAQTERLQNHHGSSWISHIQFLYAAADIHFVQNNEDQCRPGTDFSRVDITPDKTLAAKPTIKISVKPFTDRKYFEKGDAVSLLVTMKNLSSRKVTITSPLDPNIENYKILIKAPDKKERIVNPTVKGCGIPKEKITLAAGKSRHFSLQLYADSQGYLFNTTGSYEITIYLLTGTRWVKSAPVNFIVRKSKVHSKKLDSMLQSAGFLKQMLFGINNKHAPKPGLTGMVDRYPQTGVSRAVCWNIYYGLKQKLKTANNHKKVKPLTRQIIEVINTLVPLETSGIRKGKLLIERQKAMNYLKQGEMRTTTTQKKNIRDYKRYNSSSIKRYKGTVAALSQKMLWCLLSCMTVGLISCSKIDYAKGNRAFGNLTYNHIVAGVRPVPAGQRVQVLFNGSLNPIFPFTTSEAGKYIFSPTVNGKYNLQFTYTDTILQFNSSLVEKADIDTTRESSSKAVLYEATSPTFDVSKNDEVWNQDITLDHKGTGVILHIVDEQQHALAGIRVCIYATEQFAQANAPYCGGSIAYLSSDNNGRVVFTGLQAQTYYINARGAVGVVAVSNQWSNDMKTTGLLQSGGIISKNIVLK